jgi:hypothetical protein
LWEHFGKDRRKSVPDTILNYDHARISGRTPENAAFKALKKRKATGKNAGYMHRLSYRMAQIIFVTQGGHVSSAE